MYYKKNNPHGGATEKNIIDFSASVNPLGPPSSVIDAAKEALGEIDRYPDPYAEDLVKAIATYEGVPSDYIICGNGASEIIYSYCAALKMEKALEIAPTFSEYEEAVRASGGEMLRYVCEGGEFVSEKSFVLSEDYVSTEEFLPDDNFFDRLSEVDPQVVFICNPNNPTGKLLPKVFIERVLTRTKTLGASVFIDECFMDLSVGEWSSKEFLKEYPNLFILKAFTKTFALPGLRLGYGLCSDEELLAKMSELAPPWNVSSVAQAAGIAAVRESEYLREARNLIAKERAYLTKELNALGFKTIQSYANFILFFDSNGAACESRPNAVCESRPNAVCESKPNAACEANPNAACESKPNDACESKPNAACDLRARLLKKGFAIRDCANFPGLYKGWYRIAIRNHEDNQKLIDALGSIDTELI